MIHDVLTIAAGVMLGLFSSAALIAAAAVIATKLRCPW